MLWWISVDPGPPDEEEELKDRSRDVVERLKSTVSCLPKRRQHMPAHPGWVYAYYSLFSYIEPAPGHLPLFSGHYCLTAGTGSCAWRCQRRKTGLLEPLWLACRWEWLPSWWVWHGMVFLCITQRNMAGATLFQDEETTWRPQRTLKDLYVLTGTVFTQFLAFYLAFFIIESKRAL